MRKFKTEVSVMDQSTKNLLSYRTREAAKVGQSYDHKGWMKKVADLGWRCVYCNKKLTPRTLTLDHVIPFKKGGSWNIDNLVPACADCNNSKSNRPVEEFLQKLKEKQEEKKAVGQGITTLIEHSLKNFKGNPQKAIVRFKIKNGTITGARVKDAH